MGRSSKKSQVVNNTETNVTDNRQVVSNGIAVGQGGQFSTWEDSSTNLQVTDSSDRSFTDNSDRSFTDNRTTTTTINNADAARINAQNTELLREVAITQADGVKAIAGFGAQSLKELGGAATDIFEASSANAGKAWSDTLDLIGDTLAGTQQLAQASLATYQPLAAKESDNNTKAVMLAAAGLGALVLLTRTKA